MRFPGLVGLSRTPKTYHSFHPPTWEGGVPPQPPHEGPTFFGVRYAFCTHPGGRGVSLPLPPRGSAPPVWRVRNAFQDEISIFHTQNWGCWLAPPQGVHPSSLGGRKRFSGRDKHFPPPTWADGVGGGKSSELGLPAPFFLFKRVKIIRNFLLRSGPGLETPRPPKTLCLRNTESQCIIWLAHI